MRILKSLVTATFMIFATGQAATAQAPPPLATWSRPVSGAAPGVCRNGACYFQGQVGVSGQCSWSPSSRGGLLAIIHPNCDSLTGLAARRRPPPSP